MPRHRPEFRAKVVAEWKAGAKQSTLAAQHGISKNTVTEWTEGLERDTPLPGRLSVREIVRLEGEGMRRSAIAKRMGVSKAAITQAIQRDRAKRPGAGKR